MSRFSLTHPIDEGCNPASEMLCTEQDRFQYRGYITPCHSRSVPGRRGPRRVGRARHTAHMRRHAPTRAAGQRPHPHGWAGYSPRNARPPHPSTTPHPPPRAPTQNHARALALVDISGRICVLEPAGRVPSPDAAGSGAPQCHATSLAHQPSHGHDAHSPPTSDAGVSTPRSSPSSWPRSASSRSPPGGSPRQPGRCATSAWREHVIQCCSVPSSACR